MQASSDPAPRPPPTSPQHVGSGTTLTRSSPTKRTRAPGAAGPEGSPSPTRREMLRARQPTAPSTDQENELRSSAPTSPLLQPSRGRSMPLPPPLLTFDKLDAQSRPRAPASQQQTQPQQQEQQRRVSPGKSIMQALRRSPSPKRQPASRDEARPRLGDAPKGLGVEKEFEALLETLEVPAAVRIKLNSLEPAVKASMLRGNATLNLGSFGLDSRRTSAAAAFAQPEVPRSASGFQSGRPAVHSPLDAPDVFIGGSTASPFSPPLGSRAFSKEPSSSTPASFSTFLRSSPAQSLDTARVKNFRVVLAAESPTWIHEFCAAGGYTALIERLDELLAMEWREEQHDDLLLHELLRCFVALNTTDRGKAALASRALKPFAQLTDLLFSEKKPGDLTTRRHLVELLLLLPSLPISNATSGLSPRESSALHAAMPPPHHLHPSQALLSLLHNPQDASRAALVDFVKAGHVSRPFKCWMNELAGVCRDYFWVFCHGQNRFWHLPDVDQADAEGPKVPGGMTGGVEFEAMGYLTMQLRLLNRVGSDLQTMGGVLHGQSAAAMFHDLLFASGLERALATLRKASQSYYAPLHLELARYVALADAAALRLPANLEVWRALPAPAPSLSEQMGIGCTLPSPPLSGAGAVGKSAWQLYSSEALLRKDSVATTATAVSADTDSTETRKEGLPSLQSFGPGIPKSPQRKPVPLQPSASPIPGFGGGPSAVFASTSTPAAPAAAAAPVVPKPDLFSPPGAPMHNPYASPDASPNLDAPLVTSPRAFQASGQNGTPRLDFSWELASPSVGGSGARGLGVGGPGASFASDSFVKAAVGKWEQRTMERR